MLAVRASHPLFFHWVADPEAESAGYLNGAHQAMLGGIFIFFGFQLALVRPPHEESLRSAKRGCRGNQMQSLAILMLISCLLLCECPACCSTCAHQPLHPPSTTPPAADRSRCSPSRQRCISRACDRLRAKAYSH